MLAAPSVLKAGLRSQALLASTSTFHPVLEFKRGGKRFKNVAYVPVPKKLPSLRWHWAKLPEITGGRYTHRPIRLPQLGGRDPETGRKVNQHIGGGVKWDYFLTDDHRLGPTDGSFYEERVLRIKKDPNRKPFICLVAGTRGKRWLVAVHGVKEGQIIRTSCYIPATPVRAEVGDAYPVGALPPATQICQIEFYPGRGPSMVMNAAGSSATVVRRHGDFVVIKLPSKHEISVKKECMVTVGCLSNVDHKHEIIGSGAEARRRGIRPSSGLHHRKTGYMGRKVRALPPIKVHDKPIPAAPKKVKFTLTKKDLNGEMGTGTLDQIFVATNFAN